MKAQEGKSNLSLQLSPLNKVNNTANSTQEIMTAENNKISRKRYNIKISHKYMDTDLLS